MHSDCDEGDIAEIIGSYRTMVHAGGRRAQRASSARIPQPGIAVIPQGRAVPEVDRFHVPLADQLQSICEILFERGVIRAGKALAAADCRWS